MSDMFICGGIIVDPQRMEKYRADIWIEDGKIRAVSSALGCNPPEDACVIDAQGMYVCPGFIDPHGHIDGHAYTGELSLLQGITTTIGGNCGFSPIDLEAFFSSQESFPIHQAELIGMCALREAAGATDPFQPASEEQIDRMVELCHAALEKGAAGVSLGPAYTPGSSIMEMQALCREAKRFNRPVSIDTRMNSMTDLDSLQEAIDLADATGCTMVVSHFVYQYGVGVEEEALKMVDAARARGIDMHLDSGMYKDWCSSIGAALFEPGIMRANGIGLMHLRMITGEHIGAVPDEELYVHLREEHPHDAVAVFTGKQDAVYTIARWQDAMISTDTGAYNAGEGHPQIAGSFPRFFRELVRERKELTWEEAVRRVTLLPAEIFGLTQKGRIQPGCDADIVIFNPKVIADGADFPGIGSPNAANNGLEYVLVGGKMAVRDNAATGMNAGRAIRITD